jgi:putative transposase
MKRKKNKFDNRLQFLEKFKSIIEINKNHLPKFTKNNNYKNIIINNNSWFDISKTINKTNRFPIIKSTDKLDDNNYKEIKVRMVLNDIHKKIFQKWFNITTLVYNESIKYIHNNHKFTKKDIIRSILTDQIDIDKSFYDKYHIRNQMNLIKKQIQKDTSFIINKEYTKNKLKDIKCSIDIHTLDKTIFQLVQNIKSAVSNLLNGNIKRFRLKFWKHTRPSKIIEFEKNKISNGILCKSIFGHLEDIKYFYNNKPFDISKIVTDFKINYNNITNEYYLLVPVKINKQDNLNNKLIVLDPGLRTFMTGLSDNEHVKIGTNVHKIIRSKIKKLNYIKNNKYIPIKIKKKNEKIINRKIKNKINELHWKTINYLINNYNTIFLGDMSAKSIVNSNKSILSNESKVACLRTGYYEFLLRLKYKCSITSTKFKLVNECYTSKTCSLCGSYNDNLGGNKIFNCYNCGSAIDRDINGCRNIYMKQFIERY